VKCPHATEDSSLAGTPPGNYSIFTAVIRPVWHST